MDLFSRISLPGGNSDAHQEIGVGWLRATTIGADEDIENFAEPPIFLLVK